MRKFSLLRYYFEDVRNIGQYREIVLIGKFPHSVKVSITFPFLPSFWSVVAMVSPCQGPQPSLDQTIEMIPTSSGEEGRRQQCSWYSHERERGWVWVCWLEAERQLGSERSPSNHSLDQPWRLSQPRRERGVIIHFDLLAPGSGDQMTWSRQSDLQRSGEFSSFSHLKNNSEHKQVSTEPLEHKTLNCLQHLKQLFFYFNSGLWSPQSKAGTQEKVSIVCCFILNQTNIQERRSRKYILSLNFWMTRIENATQIKQNVSASGRMWGDVWRVWWGMMTNDLHRQGNWLTRQTDHLEVWSRPGLDSPPACHKAENLAGGREASLHVGTEGLEDPISVWLI